jgi:two-component system chemotaxis response regulator CheY
MATLMLVDDEPSILEVYRNVLEIRDHVVIAEAHDGEEAVVLYNTLKTKPDVILMDHRMPRSNGITAMKNIHLINPLQCIIFVTADYDAAKTVMELGAHSFILKPFRMDALFNSIEVALADMATLKNHIRESFLGLTARLSTNGQHNIPMLSERLEKEVIDKFIPGKGTEPLAIETMANWLCKFFNLMGLDFSYDVSGNRVSLRNTRCVWMESMGPNPMFCLAARCVISRFAMKTGLEFNMDSTGTIMGGDDACGFQISFLEAKSDFSIW